MERTRTAAGITWIPLPGDWPASVRGGVSARRGGVSSGPLQSLNLGTRVGDRPENVRENLARLSRAAGIDLKAAARIQLAHGAAVLHADRRGILGTADAMYTTSPGLPLALTVADCLPLLLCAGERAVALAHCGWRGIVAHVAASSVAALCDLPGIAACDLRAWIGPGIGPCCFRITEELRASFPREVRRSTADGGYQIDLPRLLRRDLIASGVPDAQISDAGMCTACARETFYSHRRDEGRTGRMLAWIVRSP